MSGKACARRFLVSEASVSVVGAVGHVREGLRACARARVRALSRPFSRTRPIVRGRRRSGRERGAALCVCACLGACVCACVRACVRARARVRLCACVCACDRGDGVPEHAVEAGEVVVGGLVDGEEEGRVEHLAGIEYACVLD